jgi:hypothetical protein
MKTTLVIPDPVFRDLKRRAAERGTTMSELATEFLVRGLREKSRPKRPFRLPSFSAGSPLVNIADRDELYRAMDAERDARLYGAKQKD